jgi:hypothetical protein
MPSGFFPFGEHGQKRDGICGLCGHDGLRSKTHVPARAAGNDQPSATMGYRQVEGLARVHPGSLRQGGAWRWLLCESCNGIAGRYDEEFLLWWRTFVVEWPKIETRRAFDVRQGRLRGKPGAFVRSVLAGMFAMNPTLRVRYPVVAQAILTGSAVEAPEEMRLLLRLYRGKRRYVVGMMGVPTIAQNSSASLLEVEGEWAWPPFHLVLTNSIGAAALPNAMEIMEWLSVDPTTTHDVYVRFGVVDEPELNTAKLMNSSG